MTALYHMTILRQEDLQNICSSVIPDQVLFMSDVGQQFFSHDTSSHRDKAFHASSGTNSAKSSRSSDSHTSEK